MYCTLHYLLRDTCTVRLKPVLTKSRRVFHLSDIIIAVEVTLRKLAGKCVCLVERQGNCVFPAPGVACLAGVEKIAYGVRRCIEEHSMDVSSKFDMQNVFIVVSRQPVLDVCSTFSPELIPWVHLGAWVPTPDIAST